MVGFMRFFVLCDRETHRRLEHLLNDRLACRVFINLGTLAGGIFGFSKVGRDRFYALN